MTDGKNTMGNRDVPVAALTGVGEKRAEAFAKAGIFTMSDLLHYYPRAYQNRGDVRPLETIREITKTGEPVTCSAVLTVGTEPQVRRIRNNMTLVKFSAFDETGTCEITYFHMEYVKRTFHVGAVFRFFGRFTPNRRLSFLPRRHPESNRGIKVLQTSALPLGYVAVPLTVYIILHPRGFVNRVSENI